MLSTPKGSLRGFILPVIRSIDYVMHKVLIDFLGVQVTGWKIIGYSGALMFSARWFVQMWASRVARKPSVPLAFWLMSIVGSLACLAYFTFGKTDSVGVLSNLFPCGVAAYNLSLETVHRRSSKFNSQAGESESPPIGSEVNTTSSAGTSRR